MLKYGVTYGDSPFKWTLLKPRKVLHSLVFFPKFLLVLRKSFFDRNTGHKAKKLHAILSFFWENLRQFLYTILLLIATLSFTCDEGKICYDLLRFVKNLLRVPKFYIHGCRF